MRKFLIKSFVSSFGILLAFNLFAKDLSEASKIEINHLLDTLETSNCQFNRNGDWHSSKEAKAHLTKKLNYAIDKGQVGSSEDFIELAASKSSVSGKVYLVKCGDSTPMASGVWLKEQLQRLRAKK